jgi:hypothetical protein
VARDVRRRYRHDPKNILGVVLNYGAFAREAASDHRS